MIVAAILAGVFLTPLAIGVLTGNARPFMIMTAMSVVIPPVWVIMAICAYVELRGRV